MFFLVPKNIENENFSSLRVFLINKALKIQDLFFKIVKYPLNLYRISNGEIYANVDGIFLDTSNTFRYFKITDSFKFKNQGQFYNIFFEQTKKKNIFRFRVAYW